MQLNDLQVLKTRRRGRELFQVIATVFALALAIGTAHAQIKAPQGKGQAHTEVRSLTQAQAVQAPNRPHRFFDKTNMMLFTGVAAVRALDFTSTQHFRSYGHNEVLLTNSIVDNKPLFASIEVAGTALSIAAAYIFYRTGHYKLERWVSIIHIGVGAFGDIRNYSLGAPR